MSDATVSDDGVVAQIAQRLSELDPKVYQLVFYGLLLVWMAWLMVTSWEWSWANKLVPLFAGVPTLVLLLVKLVAIVSPETYARVTPGSESGDGDDGSGGDSDLEDTYQQIRSEDEDTTRPRPEQISYALRMLGWALALPAAMYFIGFANALILFVLLFGLRYFESPRDTVIVTVAFSVLMYLFFWQIIGLNPWTGTLDIPSIVDVLGLG
jgi:hypothetical protein